MVLGIERKKSGKIMKERERTFLKMYKMVE